MFDLGNIEENITTEFKEKLNDSLEREVVAFLNSDKGGDIYIGISDDKNIIGVDNADKLQLIISDRLKNNIEPSILGLYEIATIKINAKTIIKIVITRGTEQPYYIKKYGMSIKGCVIRVGSGVVPMHTSMIEHLFSTRTKNSLRNIISPRQNLSFEELKIYYAERGLSINDNFLENLDLFTKEHQYNYIAFLLADNNNISIKVAKYNGVDKVDLVENEEYGFCSLIKATKNILSKLDIENRTFTKITGDAQRIQYTMIDKVALREALINAIVHNDYTKEVFPLVEIYSNRLTITSYGGLVSGLSKEELFEGRSIPRNRELMRIFRDLEFVEHLGSGIHRILKVYDKNVFKISDNFFEVSFYFKNTMEETMEETMEVDEYILKLINILDMPQSKHSLKAKLGLKNDEHFRKRYLKPAIELGYIVMTIPDKPKSKMQKYKLTNKALKLKNQ